MSGARLAYVGFAVIELVLCCLLGWVGDRYTHVCVGLEVGLVRETPLCVWGRKVVPISCYYFGFPNMP